MSYNKTRARWARKFLPLQLGILKAAFPDVEVRLEGEGSLEDLTHNTDAWVGDKRAMLRIMEADSYPGEILFRKLPSVNEYAKVIAGHGDYLLYCWGHQWKEEITSWILVDLSILRAKAEAAEQYITDYLEDREEEKRDIGARKLLVYWLKQIGAVIASSSSR